MQQLDRRLFGFLQNRKNLSFALRNACALVASQLVDTILFSFFGLYGQVASDLSQPDRMRLAQRLEPGPRADLQSLYDKYQRQTLPIARDASRVVYDRFLKANRVGAGIESYDAVVRLILGTEFRGKFVPVIRAR